MIKSYFIIRRKWLIGYLLMICVAITILGLNSVPAAEIFYGICLFGFIFIIVSGLDYMGFRNKLNSLRQCEHSISITQNDLPETRNEIEQQYQRLIEMLRSSKLQSESEMELMAKNMTEYYTMWVHQIKTPIAAMSLLLKEKSDEIDVSEEQEELFRIEQYVDMALQYMRLNSESTDYVLKKVSLDSVIKAAIHKYARIFIRKKIKLSYEEINKTVVTDEKWLGFIIEQLFANAAKYAAGKTVSIYMRNDAQLVIEDTGIGIKASDLPRVMEKGYTGYNGHANRHSTGIGLYLCSKIAGKLSHGISIESEEGKGTRVILSFGSDG